jgi:Ca2+-binding RTX toxin-like protein
MGWAGDDILIGGAGEADELHGGTGDDIYVITGGGDTIVEYAGEGFDTVQTTLSAYTLRLNVEALTYIGAGDFTGTGTVEDNVITGGAGNDVLIGRGGNDVLIGGDGVDTASYASAAGPVDVRLNLGRAIRDGDGASDTLSGIENVIGSDFDDLLIGDAGDNVLSGGKGRDTLLGMEGNDTLIGGEDAPNQLQGGTGDDTYILLGHDTVVEFAGEGIDTVVTAALTAYTLGAHVENLTYTGVADFVGTGNELDNVITGGAGNDTLKGGAGDDILHGGAGTDLALLTGLKDDYLIEQIDGGWRVTDRTAGRDGVDLLYGIETLRFGDGQTLSLTAPAAVALIIGKHGPQVLPVDPDPLPVVHHAPGWDALF